MQKTYSILYLSDEHLKNEIKLSIYKSTITTESQIFLGQKRWRWENSFCSSGQWFCCWKESDAETQFVDIDWTGEGL